MNLDSIYDQLKGTRVRNNQLTIPDFTYEDYENLLELLLDLLQDKFNGDYYAWINRQAWSYKRFRTANRIHDEFYDPLTLKQPWDLSTREQLAILKYYLYRYTYSHYRRD